MKRFLGMLVAVAVVAVVAGVAFAQMGGPMWRGMGPGIMGYAMMGNAGGPGGCPGFAAATQQGSAQLTEEQAKALAQQYADQYLSGFTVEQVLPFVAMRGTMYSVELKGPEGQVRTFHISPWGQVMPVGGAQRRAG
jgi:hypothetical protein